MKRIISLMLALVIVISAAVPAYATGDGNFDGGGGSMGDGTKTNYWNPGMDGVRVSIVDVGSHSVVRTPIDLTNKVPIANVDCRRSYTICRAEPCSKAPDPCYLPYLIQLWAADFRIT